MSLDKFFHLKENNTTVSTEIIAGITIFFTIAYILTINPMILGESGAGMPTGAVYLATIVTTVIGCLIFGLFANIPLVPSAALGLSYFFTYTIVQFLGFTWKEAISMVFICGIINLIITICGIKGNIIKCIPQQLKIAMGAGVGLFVLYTGLINSKLINLADTKISLNWIEIGTNPAIWVFFIGLILTIILIILKIRGTFIISIIATTLIGLIPLFGITNLNSSISLMEAFEQLPTTFCAIFTPDGIPSLFSETGRIPLVIISILTFSLFDICNSIGSFIGASQEISYFCKKNTDKIKSSNNVISTSSRRALIADATATTTGAILGTSNISTYIESITGIVTGGRTGLTAVVTAICFVFCIFITPLTTVIPSAATSPILIIAGILMLRSLIEIEWSQLETAIPCFFTVMFLTLSYSIPDGIASGFITYFLIKIIKHETKDLHPITYGISILFIAYFILRILLSSGILMSG